MSLIEKALKQVEKEKRRSDIRWDILPLAFSSSSMKKSSRIFFVLVFLPFLILIAFFCYEIWLHPIEPLPPLSLRFITVPHPRPRPASPSLEGKETTLLAEQAKIKQPSLLTGKKAKKVQEESPGTLPGEMKKDLSAPPPSPVITPSPNPARLHFEKGQELFSQGNYSGAKEEFLASLAVHAFNPEAHNNLGIIFQKENNLLKAEDEFLQAMEQDPASEKVLNNLGLNCYLLMKWDRALSYYQGAIKINPGNIETYVNLALLYKRFNERVKAKAMLEKALSLNPSHPESLYNLAVLLEGMGEKGKAEEYYQKFISVSGPAYQGLAEKVRNHLSDLHR